MAAPEGDEHADDVRLARACAEGMPAALATFEARFGALIDAAAAKGSGPDLAQAIRAMLFAGDKKKIAGYGGKAPLEHWLRVVVARAVQSERRKKTPLGAPSADEEILGHVASLATPERDLGNLEMKEAYRAAFGAAFAALGPRERTLLRLHVIDKLGIDALAKALGGHRATIARQIAAARERLAQDTLDRVRSATGMSEPELASAIRSIRSQIDLSLERVLAG
jgi:RNA polymerase sigma-70 factor (ECF subfamily)